MIMERRDFVKKSMTAGAAITMPGYVYSKILGANDRIRLGIIGIGSDIKLGGKGKDEINKFRKIPGVEIAAICDCDKDILRKEEAEFRKRNEKVKTYIDFRDLLDDKDIDVVSITTPNHSHALITIMACQAGKDVFVQKPASHNIWEGRKMVEAASRYKRIVQVPSNAREPNGNREAYKYARDGNLGKIKWIHGLNFKPRMSIGKVKGEQPIPQSVNYNLWCGPAPMKPLMRKYLHYDWHWDWDTGDGDLGNMGIHFLDGCRMALGTDKVPEHAMALGGRFGYDDDGETPNTMLIYFDYETPVIFEVRGLPSDSIFRKSNWVVNKNISMDRIYGISLGVIVYCEDGYICNNAAYDYRGRLIRQFKSNGQDTRINFIDAVRERNASLQNAHVLDGHLSMVLAHMGNISIRLGREVSNSEIRERIKGFPELDESFERFDNHLYANRIDLRKTPVTLGPMLTLDPVGEKFTGDFSEEANRLVKPTYRKPFIITEKI